MGLARNGFTRWRQIPCPHYLSLLFSFFVHFVFFVVISTPASSLQPSALNLQLFSFFLQPSA